MYNVLFNFINSKELGIPKPGGEVEVIPTKDLNITMWDEKIDMKSMSVEDADRYDGGYHNLYITLPDGRELIVYQDYGCDQCHPKGSGPSISFSALGLKDPSLGIIGTDAYIVDPINYKIVMYYIGKVPEYDRSEVGTKRPFDITFTQEPDGVYLHLFINTDSGIFVDYKVGDSIVDTTYYQVGHCYELPSPLDWLINNSYSVNLLERKWYLRSLYHDSIGTSIKQIACNSLWTVDGVTVIPMHKVMDITYGL